MLGLVIADNQWLLFNGDLQLNIANVKKVLRRGMRQDYYMTNRKWPYKDVPRKIMAEKFMEDESKQDLTD